MNALPQISCKVLYLMLLILHLGFGFIKSTKVNWMSVFVNVCNIFVLGTQTDYIKEDIDIKSLF